MLRRASGFITEMSHSRPEDGSLKSTIGMRAVGRQSTCVRCQRWAGILRTRVLCCRIRMSHGRAVPKRTHTYTHVSTSVSTVGTSVELRNNNGVADISSFAVSTVTVCVRCLSSIRSMTDACRATTVPNGSDACTCLRQGSIDLFRSPTAAPRQRPFPHLRRSTRLYRCEIAQHVA